MVAEKVNLPDIAGLEAFEVNINAADKRVNLSGIQQDLVQSTGASASIIPPTPRERAGLELSKIVLLLTGLSIGALLAYLATNDIIGRYSLREAYKHVYMQVENGGEALSIVDIADISAVFREHPEMELSADQSVNLRNFLQSSVRVKTISDRQGIQINACINKKEAVARQDCAELIDVALKASSSASLNAEKIRALTEFSKAVDEHQRGFQSFWLQTAQLILLNLLLPLLTGLFGYIFGTSQATTQQKS